MVQNKKKSGVNQRASTTGNGLIIGMLLITVYFKVDSADPFNTPKLILLLVLSGFLFGPLCYSYYKSAIQRGNVEYQTVALVGFFILSLTYALFESDVLIRGLIGDTQRRNGYLHYLAIMIVFLYLVRFTTLSIVIKIIKLSIWLSLLLGSYGILQISGNDFVDWNNPYNSMISTLGNPNFASALLACFASISIIYLYLMKGSLLLKVSAILGIVISTASIILSESRQGLVVIAITLSVFLSLFLWAKGSKFRLPAILATNFLFLLGIFGMLQKGPLQSILYKDSVSVRGYYWRAGIEMFQQNPLTGVGLDNYLVNFFQYREIGYPLKYGFDISSSNAHNTLIQMFATGGLFVGISYLLLLLYVLIRGIRLLHSAQTEQKGILGLLIAAWIGLQAQSFISIDFIVLSLWSWVLAGAILGMASKTPISKKKTAVDSKSVEGKIDHLRNDLQRHSSDLIPKIIAISILIPILIIGVQLNRVEEQVFLNPSYVSNNNKELIVRNTEKIFSNSLADPYYKFKSALNLIDGGFFDEGAEYLKNLSTEDPQNYEISKILAKIAVVGKNIDGAIELREKMAKQNPWDTQNYFELALLYKELGKKEEMFVIKSRILEIATSVEYSARAESDLN